ncbi:MAG: TetR/AcrR family transcriptional regulator [Desulfofustis sp.]|nr:TetR/AcrR family transcriptional regulator [Desulfofustis sp.]
MVKRKRKGPTAERYIETTLELVAEQGGSSQVNLREISRRIGCAHTNTYNYFESREDLLWHALRRVLQQYGDAMTSGLYDSESPSSNFRRLMRNMVEWSIDNPGLHRFISSDPIRPEQIPQDIIENVLTMKAWINQTLKALSDSQIDGEALRDLVDIMLGYLDGEVFNLINGRVLPGENIAGRVINNLERLFSLLTATTHDGIVLSEQLPEVKKSDLPKLNVSFY